MDLLKTLSRYVCLLITFAAGLTLTSRAATPVILDTDIGTDIDDTWALAFLLRCPELDLKLVVSDTGDTHYRAKLIARMLEAGHRTDVPIGVGKDFAPADPRDMNLEPWVHDFKLTSYPGHVSEDGVGAIIDTVMHSPTTVTIIAIGAVPNIEEALRREPRIAARCRFVGMHGSVDVGYGGKPPPSAEANVKDFPAALRNVLRAPWKDILLTPLDTCDQVHLDGARYARVLAAAKNDPLLGAVMESYHVFAPRVRWMKCDFADVKSTTLFDCVAVYLAFSENLVGVDKVNLNVTDDGFTKRDPAGSPVRAALRWKSLDAFDDLLVARLTSAK
ncbi:MAG TPA: nucleoside hydrolase [Candidatus Didemnitutus sp.]|nr:nucleoside hydrolase [Candidatus Didemnitutus sp.]